MSRDMQDATAGTPMPPDGAAGEGDAASGDTGREALTAVAASWARNLQGIANPASLRGLATAFAGAAVLLLPQLTTATLTVVLLLALLGSATMDIVYAIAGRRRYGKRGNRVFALLRGLATIVFLAVLVVLPAIAPQGAGAQLTLIVELAGVYVVVRGFIVVGHASLSPTVAYRWVRIVGGITAVAVGVLAYAVPDTTIELAIVTVAIAAIVVGLVLVAWGLRRAEGGATSVDPQTATVLEVAWDWIRSADIGKASREEFSEGLYFEAPERFSKIAAWWVMLVLSVAIATFAVLADSTAVVIGAMLVAPLMVPILGLAGALVNGWTRRAVQSSVLVALGVCASVLLAYGLASWAPVALTFETNSQIASRVNPTLLDMLIAVAAGAAGAFATVNRRVSSGIAGVAIAVALVPPLAVVGVSLALDRPADAGGAMLLFLTNFVAIVLSAAVVFVLSGFAGHRRLRRHTGRVVATTVPFIALAALILLPLMFTSEGLVVRASDQRDAQAAVDEWLGPDSAFVAQSVAIDDAEVTVRILGPGDPPAIASLQRALEQELGRAVAVRVEVTPVTVIELDA